MILQHCSSFAFSMLSSTIVPRSSPSTPFTNAVPCFSISSFKLASPSSSTSLNHLQTHSSIFGTSFHHGSPRHGQPQTRAKGFGTPAPKRGKNRDGREKQDKEVCPCGGGLPRLDYSQCCRPFHDGAAKEPDALSVMKARYSAYARGAVGYVVRTTHPENPDFQGTEKLASDVRELCARLRFIKLEILSHEHFDDEAYVSFRAIYTLLEGGQGDKKILEERSHFVLEGDRWLFKEGLPLSSTSIGT